MKTPKKISEFSKKKFALPEVTVQILLLFLKWSSSDHHHQTKHGSYLNIGNFSPPANGCGSNEDHVSVCGCY